MGSVSLSAKTTEHLERVETAIRQAKGLLGGHSYPDDLRTVVVAAFVDQMIEHHEALLVLIRSGKVGSAFSLFRSIFEGMYRGLWINFCATDDELKKFEKDDEIPLTMAEMAKAIDDKYLAHGFYADLKKRGWKALNSYAHTGMLQLGRRFTGHDLTPAYGEEEIYEVASTATTCILLMVGRFLAAPNHLEDCREAERLTETYGSVSERATALSTQPAQPVEQPE